MIDKLEDAMDNDELIEIWEANLSEPAEGGSNKFSGRYFQGYLTEIEKSSNAEDMVEVSLTFGITLSSQGLWPFTTISRCSMYCHTEKGLWMKDLQCWRP